MIQTDGLTTMQPKEMRETSFCAPTGVGCLSLDDLRGLYCEGSSYSRSKSMPKRHSRSNVLRRTDRQAPKGLNEPDNGNSGGEEDSGVEEEDDEPSFDWLRRSATHVCRGGASCTRPGCIRPGCSSRDTGGRRGASSDAMPWTSEANVAKDARLAGARAGGEMGVRRGEQGSAVDLASPGGDHGGGSGATASAPVAAQPVECASELAARLSLSSFSLIPSGQGLGGISARTSGPFVEQAPSQALFPAPFVAPSMTSSTVLSPTKGENNSEVEIFYITDTESAHARGDASAALGRGAPHGLGGFFLPSSRSLPTSGDLPATASHRPPRPAGLARLAQSRSVDGYSGEEQLPRDFFQPPISGQPSTFQQVPTMLPVAGMGVQSGDMLPGQEPSVHRKAFPSALTGAPSANHIPASREARPPLAKGRVTQGRVFARANSVQELRPQTKSPGGRNLRVLVKAQSEKERPRGVLKSILVKESQGQLARADSLGRKVKFNKQVDFFVYPPKP